MKKCALCFIILCIIVCTTSSTWQKQTSNFKHLPANANSIISLNQNKHSSTISEQNIADVAQKTAENLTANDIKTILTSSRKDIITAYNIDLVSGDQIYYFTMSASPLPSYAYYLGEMSITFPFPDAFFKNPNWSTHSTFLTEDEMNDMPINLYFGNHFQGIEADMTIQECEDVLGTPKRQYEVSDNVSGTTALIGEYNAHDLFYTLCFLINPEDKSYHLDYLLINL